MRLDLSFVIGFHTARLDNLLQTLRFLLKYHSEIVTKSEFLAVCQNTMAEAPEAYCRQLNDLVGNFVQHRLFDLKLPCMQVPTVTNFGMNQATADRVVLLDSDRILPPGYFCKVIEQLGPKRSITASRLRKLLGPVTDEQIISGELEFREEHRSKAHAMGMRNMWAGNTAIWRADFFEAGQMNPAYVGYGWYDNDMGQRMNRIGVKDIYLDYTELHLHHEPLTYGEGDHDAMFIANGVYYCKTWRLPYPNWLREKMKQCPLL